MHHKYIMQCTGHKPKITFIYNSLLHGCQVLHRMFVETHFDFSTSLQMCQKGMGIPSPALFLQSLEL